jgi:hypothetical protein
MADKPDLPASDAAPEEPSAQAGGASIGPKGRRSLAKSRRELTEDELGQSGVRLMLLDEVDRLEAEVTRLHSYEEKFHAADKQVAVLQEKKRRNVATEVLYSVSISLGVGIIARSIATPQGLTPTSAIAGGVLVIGAIVAKVLGW